jgi:nucleoside-diphosphate-sugar epimerase
MKVLVTYADGLIGSHLVEKLLNEVYEVKALYLYNSFGKCGWLESCAIS